MYLIFLPIFLVPYLFYKVWGKSMALTLFCGTWTTALFSVIYFCPSLLGWYGWILSAFAGFSIIWFFHDIMKRQKFCGFYVNKQLALSFALGAVFTLVVYITNRHYNVQNFFIFTSNFIVSPFLETLVYYHVVFRMTPRNVSKKTMCLYFAFSSMLIAALHFDSKFIPLLTRSVSFFCFYLVRYSYPKDDQLWVSFLCHSFYNFFMGACGGIVRWLVLR